MPTPTPSQPARPSFLAELWASASSVCKGLWVTWVNLLRPKATVNYPHPGHPERDYRPKPGYRGDFALLGDHETGRTKCTACMACAKVCPDKCIHIVGEGKGKERQPVAFHIDLGLCMFCWMCVEACPFDALTMTGDYEQSVTDPRELIRSLEQLTARGKSLDAVQRPAAPDA